MTTVATSETILVLGAGVSGLDGHVIRPMRLQDIAVKVAPASKG